MKKATNSKDIGKSIKLFQIMQEHFGKSMNLAGPGTHQTDNVVARGSGQGAEQCPWSGTA